MAKKEITQITLTDLNKIDLEKLSQFIHAEKPVHFRNDPGKEAYALYAYLSTAYTKIADLGTYQGLSAIALAYHPDTNVTSFDIDLTPNITAKPNVTYIQGNCFDYIGELVTYPLMLVDLDPHDGRQEQELLDLLVEHNYKGITIWDDIHLNIGMENFWYKVKQPKHDLTHLGHHSGTGMIEFK